MTSRLSLESPLSSGALLARNAKYWHDYCKAGSASDGGKCLMCQYVMQSIMTMKASGVVVRVSVAGRCAERVKVVCAGLRRR